MAVELTQATRAARAVAVTFMFSVGGGWGERVNWNAGLSE
jgi:hypothetical protein